MSDLIKRSDAISAMNGTIEVTGKANEEKVVEYLRGVNEKIRSIPSVEPEEDYTVTYFDDIAKALQSIAVDCHKQTRLMQELIMTLEKMRKGK